MDAQTIGSRVRQAITDHAAGTPQYEIAQAVGMKPDALSRAMSGQRAFSSIELATLADRLDVDVHWLITGEEDPRRLRFAARHTFDHATGARNVPGREADERVLADIELAYRQAGKLGPSVPVPPTPAAVREALGDDFVRPFRARLEDRLGIHVVRVPELSTAYCFTIDGRHVIAIKATGNWFHENFSLAHELAHLACGHLSASAPCEKDEAAANAFAGELLMPARMMRESGFPGIGAEDLAQWIWERGVSVEATAHRLNVCGIRASDAVREWASQPTQRLLRRHWRSGEPGDAISERMAAAADRHFPRQVLRAHVERIENGEIGSEALAWMLDVDVDELGLEASDLPNGDVDILAEELGLISAP
ncbi:helix-turn-helix domain-containing protein [Cellulomonas dongxiuzhuiae]|uniref:helix-turn-helix domain-containing protein n=1 Tax=Cellulomonas dongxiuzhuiae TaxID=2819979 RepID=UPI001AAF67B4|nr:XRE family transcriptional regulator [Cellulomonas dongxiuzhuiae]MBO3089428.1 ImmA/IrrE family metallo-endopeptidase [Cellulomonas dongxiuzhuiae]